MSRVVAHCPLCAAPIYGPRVAAPAGDYALPAAGAGYTCNCRFSLLAKLQAQATFLQARADAPRAGPPRPPADGG